MIERRSSGILAHITSLPGAFGVGDLEGACFFLNFLEKSGQSYWQFLPTVPGSEVFGNSPYMGLSAFAGSQLLISPGLLVEKGLLLREDISGTPDFSEYQVDYSVVVSFKEKILLKAFQRFKSLRHYHEDYDSFCAEHIWLEDFALFMSLREKFHFQPWYLWPREIACRKQEALAAVSEELHERINYHKFVQFVFFEQWRRLRQAAKEKSIKLIGDIPIYVGLDSADTWANQSCFDLDPLSLQPLHIAGVPPDYFSDTGQRWGNPLYLWQNNGKTNEALYRWWRQRFRHTGKMVDVVRIDHFRGFASYWQIPAEEETAMNGKWVKGPGLFFFKKVAEDIKDLVIIAEDLGVITEDVIQLRDTMGFPGMKILQFAFDSDENNAYLPHNHESVNAVVYTGTHDNDTTVGWYFDEKVRAESKDRARKYANCDGNVIHRDFIRLAFASIVRLAIIPLQDALGFGSDCRMNRPSVLEGNWQWRCSSRFLTEEISSYLNKETRFYGRSNSSNYKGRNDESIGF